MMSPNGVATAYSLDIRARLPVYSYTVIGHNLILMSHLNVKLFMSKSIDVNEDRYQA
jgi:hypothetical protein